MAQINNTKKPPQFDGSNYPYWKAKMTIYIKSINRKVWKVVETKIEIDDEEAPTAAEEMLLQNNDIALSVIHDALDERTFEQIKNIERAHEAWKKLEESFEGTQTVKDKDFSHKFLRCLPSRFGTLVAILVRSGLDTMTPTKCWGI